MNLLFFLLLWIFAVIIAFYISDWWNSKDIEDGAQ